MANEMPIAEDPIAKAVVDIAYYIHTKLGPGLFESVYEAIMAYELEKRGFKVRRQVECPLVWDDLQFDEAFRADLIVNDLVIVELKAVAQADPVFQKQLLTYLKLTSKRLGLLVNFGLNKIKDGIQRVANGLPD